VAAASRAAGPRRRGTALLAAAAVVLAAGAVLHRAPRPNVVLIIIDTLRADALGAYDPAASGISPELDDLAARGVRLGRVTAQCSWTRPSIGSLLTSRYPRTLGLYRESFDVLPDSATTLAEALRASGYETVGITANPNINGVFRFDQGFDRHVDSTVVWDFMQPGAGQRRRSRRARLADSGAVLEEMTEYARSRASRGPRGPVYMQITLMDVHEGRWLVRPEFRQNDRGRFGLPWGYWDGVRQVSHDIGAFVEALESLPGWGNTLFVITSDHGQGLDDHPSVGRSGYHGLLLYGSQIDVPLILYHSPPRRRDRGNVSSIAWAAVPGACSPGRSTDRCVSSTWRPRSSSTSAWLPRPTSRDARSCASSWTATTPPFHSPGSS